MTTFLVKKILIISITYCSTSFAYSGFACYCRLPFPANSADSSPTIHPDFPFSSSFIFKSPIFKFTLEAKPSTALLGASTLGPLLNSTFFSEIAAKPSITTQSHWGVEKLAAFA